MAERRMFSKTIIDSDAFLDMPLSSQALYFHLSMRADDEGFINNPKKIQRMVGSSDDDLKLLMAKRFILVFESGVIVIKHWKIHNYIRNDRFKPTMYQEEKSLLTEKNNKSYSLDDVGIPNDNQVVYQMDTQDRLGKVSLGKDRLGKGSSSYRDGSIKQIISFWEQNGFGSMGSKTLEDFQYWIKDFEKIGTTTTAAIELILYALEIAVNNGVKKYAYVNSILQSWESSLFKSVDQVKAEDKKNSPRQANQLENTGSSEYDDVGW